MLLNPSFRKIYSVELARCADLNSNGKPQFPEKNALSDIFPVSQAQIGLGTVP